MTCMGGLGDYSHKRAKKERRHNGRHGALMEGRLWDKTLAALV
jgi:hypothetical protein